MYMVIELQLTNDRVASNLLSTHSTLKDAESKFHLVLSYAAVSEMLMHSAIIIAEDGTIIRHETYSRLENEVEE